MSVRNDERAVGGGLELDRVLDQAASLEPLEALRVPSEAIEAYRTSGRVHAQDVAHVPETGDYTKGWNATTR